MTCGAIQYFFLPQGGDQGEGVESFIRNKDFKPPPLSSPLGGGSVLRRNKKAGRLSGFDKCNGIEITYSALARTVPFGAVCNHQA